VCFGRDAAMNHDRGPPALRRSRTMHASSLPGLLDSCALRGRPRRADVSSESTAYFTCSPVTTCRGAPCTTCGRWDDDDRAAAACAASGISVVTPDVSDDDATSMTFPAHTLDREPDTVQSHARLVVSPSVRSPPPTPPAPPQPPTSRRIDPPPRLEALESSCPHARLATATAAQPPLSDTRPLQDAA